MTPARRASCVGAIFLGWVELSHGDEKRRIQATKITKSTKGRHGDSPFPAFVVFVIFVAQNLRVSVLRGYAGIGVRTSTTGSPTCIAPPRTTSALSASLLSNRVTISLSTFGFTSSVSGSIVVM